MIDDVGKITSKKYLFMLGDSTAFVFKVRFHSLYLFNAIYNYVAHFITENSIDVC